MRLIIIFALLGLVGLVTAAGDISSGPITDCGTIQAPGYYSLANDLLGADVPFLSGTQVCLLINSSDVAIDCGSYTMFDDTGTNQTIAIANNASAILNNLTIKNCEISGYNADGEDGPPSYPPRGQIHIYDVENLSLSGLEVHNSTYSVGISLENVNNITMSDLEVYDLNRSAIMVKDSKKLNISNIFVHEIYYFDSYYHDHNYAVDLRDVSRVDFKNSAIGYNQRPSVRLEDVQNVKLDGLEIANSTVPMDCDFNPSDDSCMDLANLLRIEDATNFSIKSSNLYNTVGDCFDIEENVTNFELDNVEIYNCMGSGIMALGDDPFSDEYDNKNHSFSSLHIYNTSLAMVVGASNITKINNSNISNNIIGLVSLSNHDLYILNSLISENMLLDFLDINLMSLESVGVSNFLEPLLNETIGELVNESLDLGEPHVDCSVYLTNVTGSGGRPILYLNDTTSVDGGVYSEIIMCAGNNTHINGTTVRGSDSFYNNGIFIMGGNNITISNSLSEGNAFGMMLFAVSNSNISNNVIRDSTMTLEAQTAALGMNVTSFMEQFGLNMSEDGNELIMYWKGLGLLYGSVTSFITTNTLFSNNLIEDSQYLGMISIISLDNTYQENIIRNNNLYDLQEFNLSLSSGGGNTTNFSVYGLDTFRAGFVSLGGIGDTYIENEFYNNTGSGYLGLLLLENEFYRNKAYDNTVSGFVAVLGGYNQFIEDEAYNNNPANDLVGLSFTIYNPDNLSETIEPQVNISSGGFVTILAFDTIMLGIESHDNNGYGVVDFPIPPVSFSMIDPLSLGEENMFEEGIQGILVNAGLQVLINLISADIPTTTIVSSTFAGNSLGGVNSGSLFLPPAQLSDVNLGDTISVSIETTRTTSLISDFYDSIPEELYGVFEFGGEDYFSFNMGNVWEENSSYLNGLSLPMAGSPNLETFVYDDTLVLLVSNSSNVSSYEWSGSTWQLNNSWANGLNGYPSEIYPTYPAVFEMDGLHMLLGTANGSILGFSWNGSQWVYNTSVANGIDLLAETPPLSPKNISPTVFYDDIEGNYILVVGYSGSYNGNNRILTWSRDNESTPWTWATYYEEDEWDADHGHGNSTKPRAYYSERYNAEVIIIALEDGTFACNYWDSEHNPNGIESETRCPPDIPAGNLSGATPVRIDDVLLFLVSSKSSGNFTAFVSNDSDIEIDLHVNPTGYIISDAAAPSATPPTGLMSFRGQYISLVRKAKMLEASLALTASNISLGNGTVVDFENYTINLSTTIDFGYIELGGIYDPFVVSVAVFEWPRSAISGYSPTAMRLYAWDGSNWSLVPNQYPVPERNMLLVFDIASQEDQEIYGLFTTSGPSIDDCSDETNTVNVDLQPDISMEYDCYDGLYIEVLGANGPMEYLNIGIGTTNAQGQVTVDPFDCQVEECTTDLDCPSTQECVNGECRSVQCDCGQIIDHVCNDYECCTDFDCESGSTCISNECVEVSSCTYDYECLSSEYCSNGVCVPVTSTCGYAANHEWIPYECGSQSDCPSCAPGFVCEGYQCVALPSDLTGPDSGFVGDDATFHAINCPLCEVQISDPLGRNMSALTSEAGDLALPLAYNGTYTLTLVKGSVPVKTASVRALSRSPGVGPVGPSFISDVAVPGAILALLLALIVVFMYTIMTRGKPRVK
ncbi:MAG: hypothetical protein ABH842_05155 [Candidatus Micrarchaeota archaeon]